MKVSELKKWLDKVVDDKDVVICVGNKTYEVDKVSGVAFFKGDKIGVWLTGIMASDDPVDQEYLDRVD